MKRLIIDSRWWGSWFWSSAIKKASKQRRTDWIATSSHTSYRRRCTSHLPRPRRPSRHRGAGGPICTESSPKSHEPSLWFVCLHSRFSHGRAGVAQQSSDGQDWAVGRRRSTEALRVGRVRTGQEDVTRQRHRLADALFVCRRRLKAKWERNRVLRNVAPVCH